MIHPPAHRLIAARIRPLAAAALLAGSAGAAAGEPPPTLPPLRAVAAPLDRAAPDSLPASLDRIRPDAGRRGNERGIGDALRRVLPLRGARLAVFARVENLFDRAHVASVIVNESNRRYHEPGPGRSLLFGLEWNRP